MLISNNFQQCISYPLKLQNKNILDSTEDENRWTVKANVIRMKTTNKCALDDKIITKPKIKSVNLDGVLHSVGNILRRSRRLHNQRINEIRKFRRNQCQNGLGGIDTFLTDDVINRDDPLVRVKDSSEFVMHYGGSSSQELFMKCLGMQRSKNPMVMGANCCDREVYVNDDKFPETSAIAISNDIASNTNDYSFEASSCNYRNSNLSLPCSQNNNIEGTVSISICDLLEDVFMIYPHDLLSHDIHEMEKLHEEHNWRLGEMMRIRLDS